MTEVRRRISSLVSSRDSDPRHNRLQIMQPTEGQRLYLGMESLNVKIVREPLVVVQVYGSIQSLNMKVSSMLVISVTIKLHNRVV